MSTESAALCFTSLPLSWCDHLIAILVNQGRNPTVPYQALVIRESAKLFLGFAPWGQKAFSAREPGAAVVYSPDSVDCTTPTPRRATTQPDPVPADELTRAERVLTAGLAIGIAFIRGF